MKAFAFAIILPLLLMSQAFGKEIVVVVAFPHPVKKFELIKKVAKDEGISVKAFYVRRVDELREIGKIDGDIFILDVHGDDMKAEAKSVFEGKNYYILSPPPEGRDFSLLQKLFSYYSSGGSYNFRNMLRLLAGKEADPPKMIPTNGFYIKGKGVFEEIPESLKDSNPVIVTFHRAELVSEDTEVVDALIDKLKSRGREAIGFFYSEFDGIRKHLRRLYSNQKVIPSIIVNLRLMFMNYEEERKALEELGVLTLGGHVFRGKLEEWEKSDQGLAIPTLPFYYTIQEYMGIVDLTVVGYEDRERRAIDFMLENFSSRVDRWLKLKEMKNSEKKVAVIYYNYPPKEGNISASNLNVPRSLEMFLREAKSREYSVDIWNDEEIRERLNKALSLYHQKAHQREFTECFLFDEYVKWFRALPERVQKEVNHFWGEPQKDPYLRDGCFLIPVVRNQNFAFLPLAPRGHSQGQNRDLYHSSKVPPSHYYLAFYLFIQRNFDALIHFGTHGTQEWTPGKERALSIYDYPYLTLGDIPVIYPYIVDNIGEAINAKRRGRALIISHQTPPFAPTGTYGELEELHQLLHRETQIEGRQKEVLRRTIAEKSLKSRIAYDLGFRSKEEIISSFDKFSKALHDHIHEIASQSIPLGLHTLGETKREDFLILTILQILGKDWIGKWENINYVEFLAQPLETILKSKSFSKIKECLSDNSKECEKIRELFTKLDASQELNSLFLALDGKYIKTSYGGDPIKNPDSLPTGRNLYSFDPSRVPTLSAWQTAVELTDEMLKEYFANRKEYPKKIAFSFWSTETMRHFGVTEAQALYLMGVRPKWDRGGVVTGIEIIPKEELKRPRIDVVVSATGLYRDHFPNLMEIINQASKMVASLDETDNFVRDNTEKIKKRMIERGINEKDAERLSTLRTFTNEAGAYGTGLDEAVSKERDRKVLSKIFVSRMGYFLKEDGSTSKVEGLFEENLKDVQSVILSRSSNLYGLLSSDDPFQYLGGVSMAVEVYSGKRPEVLIANLRSAAKIQSAEQFLLNEVRSRYLNPEWIKSMIKEGASGVTTILDTVNNLYGWQIVAPQVVKSYLWKEFKEVYIDDKYRLGIKDWLSKNPQALKDLKERISEGMKIAGYGLSGATNSYKNLQTGFLPIVKGNLLERAPQKITMEEWQTPTRAKVAFWVYLLVTSLYLYGFIKGILKEKYSG